MKKLNSIIILSFLVTTLSAQNNRLTLQFSRILFSNLADTVEKMIPVKIYYSSKWVDSLYLDINTVDDSLAGIFSRSLENTGIYFFITDDNQLILSKGTRIKTDFAKEYYRHLGNKITVSDSVKYAPPPAETEEKQINDEYKVFKIGNPSLLARSASATLRGTVRNSENDEPVSGAVVYVEKLKAGVITDASGRYSLDVPKGQYQIEYRMVGMKVTRRNVLIYSDGVLNVGMIQSTNQLNEVTVSASRENNIRDLKMGIEKISIKMLKQIQMGLGDADLIKSSLLLPGVQTVGEASSGYNIRGGSIDQNLILFEGAPIINPSHFFGFFSAFNSDIIEDVTLYKSGIPAKYGGRISSVMDISLKHGNNEKINVSGGISPFMGKLMAEGPIIKKNSSFIVSGRTTYSDWVLGKLKNPQLQQSSASFNDVQGLLTFLPDTNNMFTISGYHSNDSFDYYEESAIEYSNMSSTLRWDHLYNARLSSQTSGIISNYSYRMDSKQDAALTSSLNYYLRQHILRSDFLYTPDDKNKIEFGLDFKHYSLSPGTRIPVGVLSEVDPKKLENEQAIEPSVYVSDEYEYTPRLVFSGGLRLTMFTLYGPRTKYLYYDNVPRSVESISDTVYYKKGQIMQLYPGLEFRLLSRFLISPGLSVKAGIQRNFQYLNMISNTISMSPTDIWKLSDSYIRPQRGDQFSFGIYKNFGSKALESSFEVYYKKLKNIIDYKGGATLLMNEHLETDILGGLGKAYGFEFMIRKQTGIITGWISYTYSRSLIKMNGSFDDERINGGKYFAANFDKPHDLKIVANVRLLRRLNLASNLVYNTGRPITYPVAFFDFFNGTRVYYSERNEFRIPDYLRMDFAATVNGNLKAKKLNHSSLSFTVYNVLGRRNPYSIYFRIEDGKVNGYKMSIFGQPVFMLTYNFKIRGNATTDF